MAGNASGGLLQSTWRYRWLIAAAVLLGALLGYGWASRQPAFYEGVSRVVMANRCPPDGQCGPLGSPAQLMRSSAVLEHAVKLSGSRISAETLDQRLEVEVAQDTDVVTIRVVDSTAKGAAQLADSVTLASEQVVAGQQARKVAGQLRSMEARCELESTLANDAVEPAGRSNDDRLREKCDLAQLWEIRRQLLREARTAETILAPERAAVPEQPISPSFGRPMAIGMLLDSWHPPSGCGGLHVDRGRRLRRLSRGRRWHPRPDQPAARPAPRRPRAHQPTPVTAGAAARRAGLDRLLGIKAAPAESN